MWGARIFNLVLFFAALGIAVYSRDIDIQPGLYIKLLLLFWAFSTLYHHLRVVNKTGSTTIDYGISYSLAFGIVAGPLGLFIFETMYRFTIYFHRKQTKTDDPEEFLDTFYNIGSFSLAYSASYYLFHLLVPVFEGFPFGFWILMFLLVCVSSFLIDIFLICVFAFLGDIKTLKEAVDFIRSRSLADIGKTMFTNGLLILFLQDVDWGMLLALFFLNYLVGHSFYSKSQSIQDKYERDKFEQMAYTDFLTGVSNRAFMDRRMAELGESDEYIGIIVADIDNFKSINDNFNHSVGDQVIQHFARTLKSYLTQNDDLFRSGGEEFTIFLRNRSYSQCSELSNMILRGVESAVVHVDFDSEQIPITYTSSFGLYFFKAKGQVSMEKGYIMADQLLLKSKQHGRNRITILNENADVNKQPC